LASLHRASVQDRELEDWIARVHATEDPAGTGRLLKPALRGRRLWSSSQTSRADRSRATVRCGPPRSLPSNPAEQPRPPRQPRSRGERIADCAKHPARRLEGSGFGPPRNLTTLPQDPAAYGTLVMMHPARAGAAQSTRLSPRCSAPLPRPLRTHGSSGARKRPVPRPPFLMAFLRVRGSPRRVTASDERNPRSSSWSTPAPRRASKALALPETPLTDQSPAQAGARGSACTESATASRRLRPPARPPHSQTQRADRQIPLAPPPWPGCPIHSKSLILNRLASRLSYRRVRRANRIVCQPESAQWRAQSDRPVPDARYYPFPHTPTRPAVTAAPPGQDDRLRLSRRTVRTHVTIRPPEPPPTEAEGSPRLPCGPRTHHYASEPPLPTPDTRPGTALRHRPAQRIR
jgi:hypothetical protein